MKIGDNYYSITKPSLESNYERLNVIDISEVEYEIQKMKDNIIFCNEYIKQLEKFKESLPNQEYSYFITLSKSIDKYPYGSQYTLNGIMHQQKTSDIKLRQDGSAMKFKITIYKVPKIIRDNQSINKYDHMVDYHTLYGSNNKNIANEVLDDILKNYPSATIDTKLKRF